MNFSIYQWLLCFILDFLLKSGLFYLIGGSALMIEPISLFMSFALGLTIFHLFSLSIASGLVALLSQARAAKFALTLIVAETVFIAGASLFTLHLESQDVNKCPGYVYSCPWSNINSQGMQLIAWTALILLVLNLLPIGITAALALSQRALSDRSRRAGRKRSSTVKRFPNLKTAVASSGVQGISNQN